MTKDIKREIKEAFHEEAHSRGFCLDQEWSDCENPYLDGDTHLAFGLFKSGWIAAKANEAKKLEGCVVVSSDDIEKITDYLALAGCHPNNSADDENDIYGLMEKLEEARGGND